MKTNKYVNTGPTGFRVYGYSANGDMDCGDYKATIQLKSVCNRWNQFQVIAEDIPNMQYW